jgi:Zn-dependent metalloprotease
MRKILHWFPWILACVAAGDAACSHGSTSSNPLAQLESNTGVKWFVDNNGKFGTPSYLQPLSAPAATLTSGGSPEAVARAFFQEYGGNLYGLNDQAHELVLERTGGPDGIGIRYATFTQSESGLPVYGSRLSVQFERTGRLVFVQGLFVPKLAGIATTAAVTPTQATAVAQSALLAAFPGTPPASQEATAPPALVIYPFGPTPVLAYDIVLFYATDSVTGMTAGDRVGMEYVIDANSGTIIQSYPTAIPQVAADGGTEITGTGLGILGDTKSFNALAPTGTAPPFYMEQVGDATDTLRFVHTPAYPICLSSTSLTSWDTTGDDPGSALDAYCYLGQVDNWWRSVGSRNSYDNAGGVIDILADDPVWPGNAAWDGHGTIHVGPRGPFPYAGSVDLDIMAHEFQHAVTQYAIGLNYYGESASINESLSDTFGEFIAKDEPPYTADFVIGELWIPPNGARNMAHPHVTNQPDCVTDSLYYNGTSDSGGAHTNTGVPNNVWYLATIGGTNDTSGVTVPADVALSWTDSEAIYLSLIASASLPSNASFRDLALALLGKAIADAGWATSAVPSQIVATACAWYAVGVFKSADLATAGLDPALCSAGDGGIAEGGTDASTDGGAPPARSTTTCAAAASDVGSGTLDPTSWGDLPSGLDAIPPGSTFCGSIYDPSTSAGILSAVTVILTPLWGQQIFDFYNPLVSAAGCTLAPMFTTGGDTPTSYTSYTCPGGGIGTINASSDANFIYLAYSPPSHP